MEESGKPMSPHVLIYAFPVAAISSITNRVTGVMLSLGCAGIGMMELFGGSGATLSLMDFIGASYHPVIVSGVKFSVAFPVTFHYFGALRHFMWDYQPELLSSNEAVAKHSYILFGTATTASVLAALL